MLLAVEGHSLGLVRLQQPGHNGGEPQLAGSRGSKAAREVRQAACSLVGACRSV